MTMSEHILCKISCKLYMDVKRTQVPVWKQLWKKSLACSCAVSVMRHMKAHGQMMPMSAGSSEPPLNQGNLTAANGLQSHHALRTVKSIAHLLRKEPAGFAAHVLLIELLLSGVCLCPRLG